MQFSASSVLSPQSAFNSRQTTTSGASVEPAAKAAENKVLGDLYRAVANPITSQASSLRMDGLAPGHKINSIEFLAEQDSKISPAVILCQNLVQIPSIDPGYGMGTNTNALADYIEEHLRGLQEKFGITVISQQFAQEHRNLIIRLPAQKSGATDGGANDALCFTAHLDTMPPQEPELWKHGSPFSGTIQDGRLYGRGAADMKCAIAAMLQTMAEVAESRVPLKRDLVIALTSGESFNCLGAREIVKAGLLKDVGAMVIGEPTANRVASAEKGCLFAQCESEGPSALSATVEPSDNAIFKMADYLKEAQEVLSEKLIQGTEHSLLGHTKFNVTQIQAGGDAVNITPDKCVAIMDFRVVPGQSNTDILGILRDEVNGSGGITVKENQWKPPIETDPNHPFVALAQSSVDLHNQGNPVIGMPYYTDGSVFCSQSLDPSEPERKPIPFIICGPGEESQSGAKDEFCEVQKLNESVRIFKRIALNYCSKPSS